MKREREDFYFYLLRLRCGCGEPVESRVALLIVPSFCMCARAKYDLTSPGGAGAFFNRSIFAVAPPGVLSFLPPPPTHARTLFLKLALKVLERFRVQHRLYRGKPCSDAKPGNRSLRGRVCVSASGFSIIFIFFTNPGRKEERADQPRVRAQAGLQVTQPSAITGMHGIRG